MNRRLFLQWFALATLPVGLWGCASHPVSDRFQRRGRFSVIQKGSQQTQSFQGRFSLTIDPELTRLDILTPLNGVVARVESSRTGAVLSKGMDDTDAISGPSAEYLMQTHFGFGFPIEALQTCLTTPEDHLLIGAWDIRVLKRWDNHTIRHLRLIHPQSATTLNLLLDEL